MREADMSFIMNVSLPAHIYSSPNGWTCLEFDIGHYYENLSRKSRFGYISSKLSGSLHENINKFLVLTATQRNFTATTINFCVAMVIFNTFILTSSSTIQTKPNGSFLF
jgi:hypothetical protein